ncbi:phage tail protein [Sphingomonas baiyangensis]|uniref:Tip attachment protein J domain-containing protein n=1 Tax=Sphingomonas baiyangensis TaxID=2572576 RepID=A0A4U1L5V5_9SPHN|nr:phage tail protein [Sphingomonas baiyangensis]TKD51650.1 hypothetical protein FBR43_13450 [Sphingomonas baiyangensis]
MATLLLTTIGGAVGGPVGAALGAIAGRAIDGTVFRPATRQGPRLNELAVQTSSYGTQVPRLFGTIRVAGTVIWSTDLIETATTDEGGKGRPDTTRYSYSASFAVLLSARRIAGVRRIWADGKLLRGEAGDLKTPTLFRLHTGDADQPPDPLIASAQGSSRTPAHRGMAYAVFEQFELADYANRIPSLTFEVEADAATVDPAAIAAAISGGLVTAEAALMPAFEGFSAHGGSQRAAIETLGEASGAWFAPQGDRLAMRSGRGDARIVRDAGIGSPAPAPRRLRTIAPADRAPRSVTVGHYDAARDYQAGLQRATRPGAGVREVHLELPAVLGAGAAKGVATAMLARLDAGRQRRRVAPGWEAMGIAPGDRVTIAGEGGEWRVAGWSLENMAVALDLAPIALPRATAAAAPGEVAGARDVVHGPTRVIAAELPATDDALWTSPRLTVLAAGALAGWRGATILTSADGIGWSVAAATRAPAMLGVTTVPPGPASSLIEDRRSTIIVELAHGAMRLGMADAAALAAGANLALVGEELIQFASAVQTGERQWRLSGLWRGRRGTEWAIEAHAAGEGFALLDPAATVTIALPQAAIGGVVHVGAKGIGDPVVVRLPPIMVRGASVRPPSPVHLRQELLSDGCVRIGWRRRSRAGWAWSDGIDAPLGEEIEGYRIAITPAGAGGAMRTSATPGALLTAEEAAGDWAVRVAQFGTHAVSLESAIERATG